MRIASGSLPCRRTTKARAAKPRRRASTSSRPGRRLRANIEDVCVAGAAFGVETNGTCDAAGGSPSTPFGALLGCVLHRPRGARRRTRSRRRDAAGPTPRRTALAAATGVDMRVRFPRFDGSPALYVNRHAHGRSRFTVNIAVSAPRELRSVGFGQNQADDARTPQDFRSRPSDHLHAKCGRPPKPGEAQSPRRSRTSSGSLCRRGPLETGTRSSAGVRRSRSEGAVR